MASSIKTSFKNPAPKKPRKKKVIEELQATGVENLKCLVILDTGANCNVVKDFALFGDAEHMTKMC